MKKQVFSMIAAAAFLLTIGGTVAGKSVQEDKIWEYEDGTLTDVPSCSLEVEPLCAIQYFKLSNGQPDYSRPPQAERRGKKL